MSASVSELAPGRHAKPETIPERLDEAVLAALPEGSRVLSIKVSGASAWVQTVRIDVEHRDGVIKPYFMKTERDEEGRRMMEGSFESEKIFNEYAPKHVPRPIAWGAYKSDPEMWFLLSDFREMVEETPDVKDLVGIVAKIHKESAGKAPAGKFGFHVPTHLGYIPNDNSWESSWEVWYTRAISLMFDVEERSHGNDDTQEELESLKKSLFEKVIPRLLRPMETNGRSVVPCLVHSDLWLGNIMVDANSDELVIFDSCAYWGHNESDLGTWRAPRYRLGQPYLREYQRQMSQSAPKADFDDRNALYALRYDLLHSAMFPKETKFRAAVMDEMKRLIAKFPGGYEEYVEFADIKDVSGETFCVAKTLQDKIERTCPVIEQEVYSVYSTFEKRWISSAVCFSAMFSGLSSFIYYPALTALSQDLGVSIEAINLTITSYLVVSGVAPSILGDMADQLGRRPTSLLAFLLYFSANIGLAIQSNYAALVTLRCLQSAGASGTLAIAYGVIADITTPAERGGLVGILMGFTNAAPLLGPVLGGVLTQKLSWRWIFWLLAILSGVHLGLLFLLLPETSRRLTGNGSQIPPRIINRPVLALLSPKSQRQKVGPRLPIHFPNPLSCLVTLFQKGTFVALITGGITYTIFSCLATSLSTQMIDLYHLNYLHSGLTYLPSGIGGMLAAYLIGRVIDRDYRIVAKRHNMPVDKKSINANDLSSYPIEKARLRSAFGLLVVSALSTVGYGWALQYRAHLAIPLVLQFLSGGSQVAIFVVIGTILTDLNPDRSATVQASYNLVRCGLGAAGVAALQAGINGIGGGWMFSVYGGLACICIALCWWLREAGWQWRKQRAVRIESEKTAVAV